MSLTSRIYSKIIFKNFKKLKKINEYYRNIGSMNRFASMIKQRSVNLNYVFTKYSFQPHNPLLGQNCMRWVCETYHTVFDYLEKKPAKSLLEIGCGFGVSTWIMKDACMNKTIGLDINKEAIMTAKKLFPEVQYICDDYKNYFKKNPSAFFDVIVVSNAPPRITKNMNNATNEKEILKHCNKFIQVGYRARNLKSFLFWKHKAEGKQLSYSTTLIENGIKGISIKYPKYYFTWHYMECFIHAIIHRYYIPL